MTDGEPEPFRMPTDPDEGAHDREQADASPEAGRSEQPPDGHDVDGVESIDDLIDEATRTAAEQAAREAAGESPVDRSADVWGDTGPGGDATAVWAAAEEASSGHAAWGDDDLDEDVWGSREQPDAQSDVVSEDTGPPGRIQPPTTRELPPDPAASVDPTTLPPSGRASAAEGMDVGDDEEPATFVFSVDDGDDEGDEYGEDDRGGAGADTAWADSPSADDTGEEPEPFRFGAGPATTSPARVPDHVDSGGDEEPQAFSFAVDEDTPPVTSVTSASVTSADAARAPADDAPSDEGAVEEWTVPSGDAADGVTEPDHDVWTFDVTTDTHENDGAETSLAESATPRGDAGWRDLEAEDEPGWSVPDLPPRRHQDDEEEPTGFAASIGGEVVEHDDDAPWTSGTAEETAHDDDAPWTSGTAEEAAHDDDAPWTSGTDEATGDDEDVWPAGTDDTEEDDFPGFAATVEHSTDDAPDEVDGGTADPPADVVAAEVHDALGDLLGNGSDDDGSEVAPVTPQDTQDDDYDQLADLDLDQFDDLEAATAETTEPTEAAEATEDSTDDDVAEDGQPLDAPTAARRVMEPGSVSFSSGGRKKRGLFG